MNKAIRELLCQRCNLEYAVWFAPNELWNQVIETSKDNQEEIHFLCPTCFTILAEGIGIKPTAWVVSLEEIKQKIWLVYSVNTMTINNQESLFFVARDKQQAKEILEEKVNNLNNNKYGGWGESSDAIYYYSTKQDKTPTYYAVEQQVGQQVY